MNNTHYIFQTTTVLDICMDWSFFGSTYASVYDNFEFYSRALLSIIFTWVLAKAHMLLPLLLKINWIFGKFYALYCIWYKGITESTQYNKFVTDHIESKSKGEIPLPEDKLRNNHFCLSLITVNILFHIVAITSLMKNVLKVS